MCVDVVAGPTKKVFATCGCEHLIELEFEDRFFVCTRVLRVLKNFENDLVQDGFSLGDEGFDFVVRKI